MTARWEPGTGSDHHGKLFARVLGSGPPTLLLHGLTGSSRYWGAAFDHLATDRTLIVPDLRGFGRSPKPTSGYGLDDHVDVVAALVDELDAPGPVVIAGHSIGCLIALRYAHRHPRVATVIGFGPPLFPSAATARAHLSAMGPMEKLFVLPGSVAERACQWVCGHRALAARLAAWTHPSLPRPIAEDSVEHTWLSYSGTLEDVLLTDHGSWVDDMTTSVRLVTGDRDRVVDLGHLRSIVDRHRSLEVWAGDHHLPLREAARCAGAIADAIRSSEGGAR